MLLSKRRFSAFHKAAKESSHYAAWPAVLVGIVQLLVPLLTPVPSAISVTYLIVVPPPSSIAIAPERPETPRLYRL